MLLTLLALIFLNKPVFLRNGELALSSLDPLPLLVRQLRHLTGPTPTSMAATALAAEASRRG